MLSSSRTEPPGWMMAVIPAAWAALTQSSREECVGGHHRAFDLLPTVFDGQLRAAIRLVWPGPPQRWRCPWPAQWRWIWCASPPAWRISAGASPLRWGPLGDHLQVVSVKGWVSSSWTSRPPATFSYPACHRRWLCTGRAAQEADVLFFSRMARASALKLGARIISRKILESSSAVSLSTSRLRRQCRRRWRPGPPHRL